MLDYSTNIEELVHEISALVCQGSSCAYFTTSAQLVYLQPLTSANHNKPTRNKQYGIDIEPIWTNQDLLQLLLGDDHQSIGCTHDGGKTRGRRRVLGTSSSTKKVAFLLLASTYLLAAIRTRFPTPWKKRWVSCVLSEWAMKERSPQSNRPPHPLQMRNGSWNLPRGKRNWPHAEMLQTPFWHWSTAVAGMRFT